MFIGQFEMAKNGKAMTIKVAINGFGTIGKRVAQAVACQDDMIIVGVTKTSLHLVVIWL